MKSTHFIAALTLIVLPAGSSLHAQTPEPGKDYTR